MNKKKKILTVIMTAVVILIWGKLVYDFISLKNGGDLPEITSSNLPSELEYKTDNFDYQVSGEYRDPFLGKSYKKQNNSATKTLKTKKISVTKENTSMPIVWPKIIYQGKTKANAGNNGTAFLVVNGKSTLLKMGSTYQGIQIQELANDSIVLSYKKDIKTFIK